MADSTSGNPNWSIYPYNPSAAPPIVFAITLGLAGILQVYQSFSRRGWYIFGRVMTFATAVWLTGFIARAISVHQQQNPDLFVVQSVMILAGPPIFAAAEFFVLGRLLAYLPYHAPLHPGRVVSTFMILSTVVESLTTSGASNSAVHWDDPSAQLLGQRLLQASLILGCLVEIGFLATVAIMEIRCRRARQYPAHVQKIVWLLYITSFMLLVRGVARCVEAFEASACASHQSCGYIATHEWVLWVFEVANITLFVILLAAFHPGRYLPNTSKVFLDPIDGVTERKGPGFSKADRRPFWLTVIDPWNLHAIITGKGVEMHEFWKDAEYPIWRDGKIAEDEQNGASSKA